MSVWCAHGTGADSQRSTPGRHGSDSHSGTACVCHAWVSPCVHRTVWVWQTLCIGAGGNRCAWKCWNATRGCVSCATSRLTHTHGHGPRCLRAWITWCRRRLVATGGNCRTCAPVTWCATACVRTGHVVLVVVQVVAGHGTHRVRGDRCRLRGELASRHRGPRRRPGYLRASAAFQPACSVSLCAGMPGANGDGFVAVTDSSTPDSSVSSSFTRGTPPRSMTATW